MGVEIVPLDETRIEEWWSVMANVFAFEARPADLEVIGRRGYDRAVAAVEDGRIVGTANVFRFDVVVPGGGKVPMGGLTQVTVLPTHRRRGVLRAMNGHLTRGMRDRGEPLAGLWASESSIYGRFGYGMATEGADITLDRVHAGLRPGPAPQGRVRLVDVDEARSVLPGIHERATAPIPGSPARRSVDWDAYFHDPEHWREGTTELRFAVCRVSGVDRGYARYRLKSNWDDAHPNYRLLVGDLQAVDGETYRLLCSFLLGIDLVTTIELRNRPIGDPLGLVLADPRRMQRRLSDALWLALVDPVAALAARCYGIEGELVLETADLFTSQPVRVLLVGSPDGAECSLTDREPDLVMSSSDLASAYLGASRIATLAWLGRITGSEAAIVRAQRMFAWHVEPWCSVHF